MNKLPLFLHLIKRTSNGEGQDNAVILCPGGKTFEPAYGQQLSIFKLLSPYQQVLHVITESIGTLHSAALGYQIGVGRKLGNTN